MDHTANIVLWHSHDMTAAVSSCERRREAGMFRAIGDVLGKIGSAIATVVTLPFRALARLFGGASDSAHGRH